MLWLLVSLAGRVLCLCTKGFEIKSQLPTVGALGVEVGVNELIKPFKKMGRSIARLLRSFITNDDMDMIMFEQAVFR